MGAVKDFKPDMLRFVCEGWGGRVGRLGEGMGGGNSMIDRWPPNHSLHLARLLILHAVHLFRLTRVQNGVNGPVQK